MLKQNWNVYVCVFVLYYIKLYYIISFLFAICIIHSVHIFPNILFVPAQAVPCVLLAILYGEKKLGTHIVSPILCAVCLVLITFADYHTEIIPWRKIRSEIQCLLYCEITKASQLQHMRVVWKRSVHVWLDHRRDNTSAYPSTSKREALTTVTSHQCLPKYVRQNLSGQSRIKGR